MVINCISSSNCGTVRPVQHRPPGCPPCRQPAAAPGRGNHVRSALLASVAAARQRIAPEYRRNARARGPCSSCIIQMPTIDSHSKAALVCWRHVRDPTGLPRSSPSCVLCPGDGCHAGAGHRRQHGALCRHQRHALQASSAQERRANGVDLTWCRPGLRTERRSRNPLHAIDLRALARRVPAR